MQFNVAVDQRNLGADDSVRMDGRDEGAGDFKFVLDDRFSSEFAQLGPQE